MKRIGIIGLANHAAKLRALIESRENVTHLYHPLRRSDDPRCTQEFDDLLGCDAIVIASPNDTHVDYMIRLKDYGGYILCEKPPAVRSVDIPIIEMAGPDRKRVMFNFPYRRSVMADALRSAFMHRKPAIGDLVSASFTMTHGLAFRESYASSWRASSIRHPLGVIETLGVHFIDLAVFVSKMTGDRISSVSHESSNVSHVGTSHDTSSIRVRLSSGALINITVSYAAPYVFEMHVIGTDGLIEARDGSMVWRGPRDTFDARGLFDVPPMLRERRFEPENMYDECLIASIDEFLRIVRSNGTFDDIDYETSIDTSWILSMLDRKSS